MLWYFNVATNRHFLKPSCFKPFTDQAVPQRTGCSAYGFPCQNNGQCIDDGSTDSATPGFYCACGAQYTGDYCGTLLIYSLNKMLIEVGRGWSKRY